MRIHQLQALVSIADSGSFTAAARQLKISQSSLSHAIAALEEELNISLLERSRQGACTTEAGLRILTHARQALSSLDSIRTEARNAAGLLFGRVRIGSIPSAVIEFLPKVIAHFSREHPQVEVILLEEPSQRMSQLLEWLRGNVIDVAIMEMPVSELKVLPLLQDELCAIVARSSTLAKRRRLSIKELADQPFVISRYNSETLIRTAYARYQQSPCFRYEVQDLGTLVSLVREGLGISIVPRVAFPAVPDGVVLLPLRPSLKRDLAFVMSPKESLAPALSVFIRKALGVAQESWPSATRSLQLSSQDASV
jgi:DNA-binding transcriptional LysR family regulator